MQIMNMCFFAFTSMYILLIQAAEPQYIMPEGAGQRRGRFEMAFSQIGGSVCVGMLNILNKFNMVQSNIDIKSSVL